MEPALWLPHCPSWTVTISRGISDAPKRVYDEKYNTDNWDGE